MRGGMSSTHGGENQHIRTLQLESCFPFWVPAQTDLASPSGHPITSRRHQQSSPYLQSSSPTSSSTLVFRTGFAHSKQSVVLPRRTSESVGSFTLRQNVNNITRAEQHGASGLIATHARFFDAGSHGGGPEIPHKAECEKLGPSSAYWPPNRATRAYLREEPPAFNAYI